MTTKSVNAHQFQANLAHFNGSSNLYFRQTLAGQIEYLSASERYTDGIRYLQQQGCCWLIDAIASYQTRKFKAEDDRQFWKLSVDLETHQAQLVCDDGNGNVRVSQDIPFTDFPLPELKIYVEIQANCVFLCLMSEY